MCASLRLRHLLKIEISTGLPSYLWILKGAVLCKEFTQIAFLALFVACLLNPQNTDVPEGSSVLHNWFSELECHTSVHIEDTLYICNMRLLVPLTPKIPHVLPLFRSLFTCLNMFFKAVCKHTMNGHQHAQAVLLWSQSVTQVTGVLAAPLWLNCERLACADNQAVNGFLRAVEVESCCCLLIKLDKWCQMN